VVEPDSPPRIAWDLLMACALAYLFISIPFIIAACNGVVLPVGCSLHGLWTVTYAGWGVDGVLWLDSFLSATCLPFLDRDREVFLPSELTAASIFGHYRRRKLWLDLVATLPYDLFALIGVACGSSEHIILLIIAAVRLPKLLRCVRFFSHTGSVCSNLLPTSLRLLFTGGRARLAKVTVLFLSAWHFFACLWLLAGYVLNGSCKVPPDALPEASAYVVLYSTVPCFEAPMTFKTWIRRDLASEEMGGNQAYWAHHNVWTSYLRSAYFVISTLSAIGWGDVRPTNPLEVVLAILMLPVAAAFIAIRVGLISSLVRCGDMEEAALKTQTDYLAHFMRHHRLDGRLQRRVSGYYSLLWSNARISQAAALSAALPPFLMRDLRMFIHRDNLVAVPPLRRLGFFPLKELCFVLKPEIFLESDLVLAEAKPATRLYLVDLGCLRRLSAAEMARGCTGAEACCLVGRSEARAHVGEEMLGYASPAAPLLNQATVEAVTHSHLFCLELSAWKALVAKLPEELGPIARGRSRVGRSCFS
jgi:voltage-gated potassium channel